MTRVVDQVPTSLQAKHTEQRQRSIVRLARVLVERHAVAAIEPSSPAGKRQLRGIPVAGAATGTSPGTDPLREALR